MLRHLHNYKMYIHMNRLFNFYKIMARRHFIMLLFFLVSQPMKDFSQSVVPDSVSYIALIKIAVVLSQY